MAIYIILSAFTHNTETGQLKEEELIFHANRPHKERLTNFISLNPQTREAMRKSTVNDTRKMSSSSIRKYDISRSISYVLSAVDCVVHLALNSTEDTTGIRHCSFHYDNLPRMVTGHGASFFKTTLSIRSLSMSCVSPE